MIQWQKLAAEAAATGTLILAGAGAVLTNTAFPGSLGGVGIALAHGLAILVMVYAVAHISGAHINPAVTIAMWALRKIKTAEGVLYIIAQLVGAAIAAWLLILIYPDGAIASTHTGAPALASFVTPAVGVLVEALLTAVLVWTILGVTDDRAPKGFAGLAIGLAVTLGLLVGASLTGAALNPARSFGPALVSGFWVNHWVYWAGPVLGALVAAYAYRCTARAK